MGGDQRRPARRGHGGGGTWSDATGGVFPDWVEVAFAGAKTIGQIDVFGLQDATGSRWSQRRAWGVPAAG